MKRMLCFAILISLVLCGCTENKSMDQLLSLRSQLQNSSCSFEARITADYGDQIYKFSMHCIAEPEGKLQFSVIEPQTITGISGSISTLGGKLEFDGTALAFELLADGQLSPVSGPWIMMKALLGGYITSSGSDGEYLRATIMDSYADDALTVDIWIDPEQKPVRAEILWDNRRILTVEVDAVEIS